MAFTPLMGLQTVIAVGISALLRANKAVCIPIVWITNPFTAVPIYSGCFLIGRFLMPHHRTPPEKITVLHQVVDPAPTSNLLHAEFWMHLLRTLTDMGIELWVGCIVVGGIGAVIAYGLARWGVSAYRERRRRRALRRALRPTT